MVCQKLCQNSVFLGRDHNRRKLVFNQTLGKHKNVKTTYVDFFQNRENELDFLTDVDVDIWGFSHQLSGRF